MPIQFRQPRRISITVSDHVYQQLIQASDYQGRSLSNFAAFLLESSLGSGVGTALSLGSAPLTNGINLQRPLQPAAMLRR